LLNRKPRVCGEHKGKEQMKSAYQGSPPRMRGTRSMMEAFNSS